MRTKFVAMAAALAFAALPTFAHAHDDELAGAAVGAGVGFAVGGPVGAAVGAGVGGTVGAGARRERHRERYRARGYDPNPQAVYRRNCTRDSLGHEVCEEIRRY